MPEWVQDDPPEDLNRNCMMYQVTDELKVADAVTGEVEPSAPVAEAMCGDVVL